MVGQIQKGKRKEKFLKVSKSMEPPNVDIRRYFRDPQKCPDYERCPQLAFFTSPQAAFLAAKKKTLLLATRKFSV